MCVANVTTAKSKPITAMYVERSVAVMCRPGASRAGVLQRGYRTSRAARLLAGRNRQDLVAVRNRATGIVLPVPELVIEACGVADWSGVSVRSDAKTESKSGAVISRTPVISPTAIVTASAVIGASAGIPASTGISANAPIEPAGWCGERAATADVSTCRRGEAVATSCAASAEPSVSAAVTGS